MQLGCCFYTKIFCLNVLFVGSVFVQRDFCTRYFSVKSDFGTNIFFENYFCINCFLCKGSLYKLRFVQSAFDVRKPVMIDDLRWKTAPDRRQPKMKENLR